MSAAAPWSVKGIEPRTREVAKDLARRSGMTLGEWLNHMIAESDEDDAYGSDRRERPRRLEDVYRPEVQSAASTLAAIEALSARIEGAERRSTLAIDGVDQAVSGLARRLDAGEGQHAARDRRIDEISDALREGRTRLRRFEEEVGPRQVEVMGALEGALGKLAGRFYESEARTRDTSTGLRDRLDRLEREAAPERVAEAVVARVSARLEEAQTRTAQSLRQLESSFADLDRRLAVAERREPSAREGGGLEKLAESLTRKVEESRAEMMRRLDTAAHDGRMDKIERALADLAGHVQDSERRSAQALEAMGREVLRIAANLDGRLKETERNQSEILQQSHERALKAVESMGQQLTKSLGSDVARVADAIEHRLRRADDHHAMALEKLGGEITRISERLAERIAQGERRAVQGVDELAEKLNRASEKMELRYDRASGELAERMRLSEERTAKLLAEARESIDRQLSKRADPAPADDWREQAFPQDAFESDWTDPGFAAAAAPADPGFPAEEVFAPAVADPEPAYAPPVSSFIQDPEPAAFAQAAPADEPIVPAFGLQHTQTAPSFADPAEDLDAFEAETEFLAERRPAGERPLSTREAIEAARAATRLADGPNEAEGDRKGFGFRLGGGKSRLQKRMEKQAKREGSTVRKALTATTTAVAVVGLGVAGALGYQRLVAEGSAIPGFAPAAEAGPLAAAAVTEPTSLEIAPPAAEAQTEARALFDQATPLIEAGDAEGVRLMSRAANLGLAPAQFYMARLYETGEAGVTVDMAEARRWTERAARGGEVRAMHNYAMFLYQGTGGERDQVEALRWFRAAAERGLVDSQYNVGRLYERGGEGFDPDLTQAYQWYIIAGRTGDADAEAGAERLRSGLPASRRVDAEAAAERFLADSQDETRAG